jgi:hypothetical protein
MSNPVKSVDGQSSWSPESSRPLDPDVWSAWMLKNRAEEQRGAGARIKVVLLMVLLLALSMMLFLLLSPRQVADMQPVVGALTGTTIAGGHLWVTA